MLLLKLSEQCIIDTADILCLQEGMIMNKDREYV